MRFSTLAASIATLASSGAWPPGKAASASTNVRVAKRVEDIACPGS